MLSEKLKKPAVFPLALIMIAAVYLLFFALILCVIFLFSLGLLSLAVSAGNIIGFITVAADLSPPAMLFAGLFCVFTALALLTALFLTMPQTVILLRKTWEWFRLTQNKN